jgi:SAM-dependent methyltransferase
MLPPWEHPDWYDLHDTTWTAGPEREPEHYKELLLSLPPLDTGDHLADVGAGTGKLARLIAKGYPELGRVTLIEPNAQKLLRAERALAEALPRGTTRIRSITGSLGEGSIALTHPATVVTVGSVLMPILELRGGSLRDGLGWLDRALAELSAMLAPGGSLLLLETLAAPWSRGGLDARVRRLHLPEIVEHVTAAGFNEVECTYRFRDRIVLRARVPQAAHDDGDGGLTRVMATPGSGRT